MNLLRRDGFTLLYTLSIVVLSRTSKYKPFYALADW